MEDHPRIVAIDPGASGGIASYVSGVVSASKIAPTIGGLVDQVTHFDPDIVYIEETGFAVFHNRSPKPMGMLQRHIGQVEGIAGTGGVPVVLVRPTMWQQACGAGPKSLHGGDAPWKRHLRGIAKTLFPSAKVTLATADALLILNYAMTKEF